MKRILLLAVVTAAGCATTTSPGKEVRSGGSLLCGISQPAWPSADRDFDRRTTLEVLAGLESAAHTDRSGLHAGTKAQVGEALDQMSARPDSSRAFISSGAAELAVQLRQLDCAVKSGVISFATADQRYGQILADVAAERSTLEPGGGGGAQKAAP